MHAVHGPWQLQRQQAAPKDSEPRAAGIQQAEMQPQLILRGVKKAPERRLRMCGKPIAHRFGQLLDLFLDDRGHITAKAFVSYSKANCLHSTQRFVMGFAPRAPESVTGSMLQKIRNFVNMR